MSNPDIHPRDAEAADYVIGVTSASERRAFERDMAADPALAAAVEAWAGRLSALAERLPSVQPSPELFPAIEAALDPRPISNVVRLADGDVVRLRRSRSRWRAAAIGGAAMAASLLLYVATRLPLPGAGGPHLVAVVNRSGDLPALIVRVDQSARTVQVRAVSTETPLGHSLELWSVPPGAAPRSLGLVGTGATRVSLPQGAGALETGVTIAVSVEPQGGSPTGSPTGPVVYSGRLVPDAE